MYLETYKKLVPTVCESILTTLGYQRDKTLEQNIVKIMTEKSTKSQDQLLEMRGSVGQPVSILLNLSAFMRFNDCRILEFEMRNGYNLKTNDLIHFLNSISSLSTRDSYKKSYYMDLAKSIDGKKEILRKDLYIDDFFIILIIMNEYRLFDLVSLMAQIILSQYNLYLGKEGV